MKIVSKILKKRGGPINASDEAFFDKLWLRHYPDLEKYARTLLQNSVLEEDAIQETFLTAVRKLDIVKSHPNPGGWLMVTLKYVILRTVDAEIRQTALFQKVYQHDGFLYELFPSDISERDAWLLNMRYERQCSVAEICAACGITEGACKMGLYYARQRIKRTLDPPAAPDTKGGGK